MTKENRKTVRNRIDLNKLSPFPRTTTNKTNSSTLPGTWLLSSFIFLLISTVVGPVFWTQFDSIDQNTEPTTLNILLGVCGVILYFMEPFIWHNVYSGSQYSAPQQNSSRDATEESLFSLIAGLIIYGILGVLIAAPYVLIVMFKPVFRALVLYVSLGFLNIGGGNLGVHPVFVVIVVADVLLYYFGFVLDKWNGNPATVLIRIVKIKNRRLSRLIGSALLTVHIALIYTLLLNVVHYDVEHNPEHLSLKSLSWWWLFLTVYTRLQFIPDDLDVDALLSSLPRRTILIIILSLIISYIAFIWPFWAGL